MMVTSRQLVYETLEFKNTSHRVPRQMWTLPWATSRYPDTMEKMRNNYPDDIVEVPAKFKSYGEKPKVTGGWFDIGDYIDEWGCTFTNIHEGVVGEVKKPIVTDDDWNDISKVHFPEELLTLDVDKINAYCASTDKFVLQSDIARPFERMQFIRGTENLLMDFALKPKKMFDFMARMHDFYCRLLTLWAKSDVDGLFFMDDWGTQRNLLINPKMWVEVIKPMYKDYADIANKHGKKILFHSDGYTLDIIPHLIEIGIDAANLQIFCIGIDKLEKFKGEITFWGEIDRQGILPNGTLLDVEEAVNDVYHRLWKDGGLIAQCEFGPGANPDNVYHAFEIWNKMNNWPI